MKFTYLGDQSNKDVRIAGSYANAAFSHANAAFIAANTGGGSVDVGTIAITVDNFTSNGNTTTYTLSTTPTAEQYVTVGLNGLTQFRNTYTVVGNIITFDSTFENGSNLEITTISGTGITVLNSANNTNAAFLQANAAFLHANAAFTAANNAVDTWVRDAANSASSYANGAFASSNTRLSTSGGTISGNLVVDGNLQIGSTQTIATNDGGGLTGWGSSAAAIAYSATVITAYPVGSTITFQDGSTATIIQWDDYGPLYIDLFWDTPKTGTIFPITLKTSKYLTFSDSTVQLTAYQGYGLDNVARYTANDAFIQANTGTTNAASASLYANAAFLQANTATNNASSASLYANAAFLAANNAVDTWVRDAANASSSYANSAFIQANAAFEVANSGSGAASAGLYANAAFLQANVATSDAASASLYANAAFLAANNAVDTWVRDAANAASSYANSAFVTANNALPATGGTITGSLTISQNLIVEGNTTFLGNSTVINTSTLELDDTLIYLGGNNYSSDAVSIGIVANYNDVANAHVGIVRDPVLKEWLFFEGYTPEVESNNLINIAHPSFSFANVYVDYLKGNVTANTVTIDGVDVFTFITNAYTQANTGVTNSLSASSYANSAFLKANTVSSAAASASLYANAAFIQANVALADAATADDKAVTAGSYANSAFLQANAAFAVANSSSGAASAGTYANAAFIQANSAYELANAAAGGGTLLIQTDNFTANGNTTTFGLGVVPVSESYVTVSLNGLIQFRNTYTITGNVITFDSVFENGSNLEITTISGAGITVLESANNTNAAFLQANTATTNASVADDKAVTSGSYANSAFSRANNSLQLTGGTIAGNVTANSFIANTSIYSPIYYSPGGTTNLLLSDIGIVAINSNGQETKFGAAGIESIGVYSGSFGGNKISLNNETNLISNRLDTVKIQTGTTGTISNEWSFSNNTLIFPDSSVQLTAYQGYGLDNVARYTANTATSDAASASLYANAAFLKANTATSDAASASLYANAAFAAANTGGGGVDTWVRDAANASSSYANSAFLQANAAFEVANTPVSVTTDTFAANGSTSTFTLSVTPGDKNLVTSVIDGIVQLRDTYILTGNIIEFNSIIYTGANVEFTTIGGGGGGGSGGGTSSAAAVGYSLIFGG